MRPAYRNPLKTGALAKLLGRLRPRQRSMNEPATKKRWRILGRIFAAHTKSEARALAKEYFHLDRLPVRLGIEQLDVPGSAAA